MNRFYFYVTRIEDYFNRYSDRIVFISSQNCSLNPSRLLLGFTTPCDSEKTVYLMVDAIFSDRSCWRTAHVLIHEISHSVGGSEDLFPVIRASENYDVHRHINDIATGKTINDLKHDFLGDLIQAYAERHKLPEDTITSDTFLQIFQYDKMLRANIIMENADFIPYFIHKIAIL